MNFEQKVVAALPMVPHDMDGWDFRESINSQYLVADARDMFPDLEPWQVAAAVRAVWNNLSSVIEDAIWKELEEL